MWNISVYADELHEAGTGFEPGLALVRRLGLEHIDLRLVNGRDSCINASGAQLDEAERLLRKHGVKVAALGTPLFKCPLRGSIGPAWGNYHSAAAEIDYEHYLGLLPRAFDLADRFGTDNIRCFAFWREHPLDEVFDEVVEKLGRAAKMAEAAGHRLYLENEHNTMAGTGIEQARILKAVNSPSLIGIYDDGNSARIGGVPYPDDYNAMRGLIGHVHIKTQRLDVMCGWMSPARPEVAPRSGYRPYFPWRQPELPFKGEIKVGEKLFRINGQRTFETAANSVWDHHRALLEGLKRDGYRGVLTLDSGYPSLDRRQGRTNPADMEADARIVVESLKRLIRDVWEDGRETTPALGPDTR